MSALTTQAPVVQPQMVCYEPPTRMPLRHLDSLEGGFIRTSRDGAVRQIPIERSMTQVVQVEQIPGCPVYFEEDTCTSTELAARGTC